MFRKKTTLNVRPEPPSFAEITEDINSVVSNDIVFTQGLTNESPSNGSPESMQQTGVSRTSSSSPLIQSLTDTEPMRDTGGVDLVYWQAVDFISYAELLKTEMAEDQNKLKSLRDACVEVNQTLEAMKWTVNELRTRTE